MSEAKAKGIATKIKSYSFMCSIITWYDILYEINIASKMLQTMDFDITNAIAQLNTTKQFLVDYCTDNNFESALKL